MSALFHLYVCGHKAAEWLICMAENNLSEKVSKLNNVVWYFLNQKQQLIGFLDYRDVAFSKNLAENAICPFKEVKILKTEVILNRKSRNF